MLDEGIGEHLLLRRTSGQMKIQQMICMLVAVTLLFVLVGIFFLSINLTNIKQKAVSLAEENSM